MVQHTVFETEGIFPVRRPRSPSMSVPVLRARAPPLPHLPSLCQPRHARHPPARYCMALLHACACTPALFDGVWPSQSTAPLRLSLLPPPHHHHCGVPCPSQLDFRGRATHASCKNIQLTKRDGDQSDAQLLMGKVDDNKFNVRSPPSASALWRALPRRPASPSVAALSPRCRHAVASPRCRRVVPRCRRAVAALCNVVPALCRGVAALSLRCRRAVAALCRAVPRCAPPATHPPSNRSRAHVCARLACQPSAGGFPVPLLRSAGVRLRARHLRQLIVVNDNLVRFVNDTLVRWKVGRGGGGRGVCGSTSVRQAEACGARGTSVRVRGAGDAPTPGACAGWWRSTVFERRRRWRLL